MIKRSLLVLLLFYGAPSMGAPAPLLSAELSANFNQHIKPDTDKASLQRGAQLYFNYCAGCHSLQYETYANVADYLQVSTLRQKIITQAFLFDSKGDINQTIQSALSSADGQRWFGVAPPDLTTIASQKTPSWLYAYLRGFYTDPSRPQGANNIIAFNTAMPNVLETLRGQVQPVIVNGKIDHLLTVHSGHLSPLAFDRRVKDLVNFLSFIAEPWRESRIWLGITICPLLFLLALICRYLFKNSTSV